MPSFVSRVAAPALAVLSSVVFAADPAATSLDPVVVTASRSEQRLSDTLASVVVITRAEIERAQAGDIAELLRFHAGVELGRTGGPGQAVSVFVRGGESDHTLVLIDGVRINPSTFGGAALQNIHPDAVERIEIVKGPRASLYGSEALAGVINIVTRRASAPRLDASLRGGSYDTRDASAFAAGRLAGADVSLQAQHLETAGFAPLESDPRRRGFRQSTVNFGAAGEAGPLDLGLRVWNTQGESEYMAFNPATFALDLPADQAYRNQVVAADGALQLTPAWRSILGASRMLDDIDQRQGSDFARTQRTEVDWQNWLALVPGQSLGVGATAARENVDARSSGTPLAEDRDLYTARLQYGLDAGRHHALVAAGYADHEAFGGQATWNAEYGFDVFTVTRLVASAGSGFRAPSALDRFGPGGNPDLDPERSLSYELGVRQRVGEHQVVDLRAFQTEVTDLINFPPPSFTAENVDEYRNRGVELSHRLEAGAWTSRVAGLLQHPEDRGTGQPLLRRARRSATLGVVRRFGGHSAGIDLLASGARPDIDFETFARTRAPGYAVANLTGEAQLGAGLRLLARVENLLDKDYQTADGYAQSGRAFFAGVRAGF